MKTLDRYIVRSFLFSAVLWFLIFMSLRVLIDMFVNFDEFAKQKMGLSETILSICSYYGYHSVVYFVELGGVIVVLSAVTTLVIMNRTNELTAILASGVSLHRVVLPLAIATMFLEGLIVMDQELVVPRVADKLVWNRDDVPGTAVFPIRLVTDENQAVWYARRFRPTTETMEGPRVFLRDSDYNALGYLAGQQAVPGQLDGRRGWVFSGGVLVRMGADWLNTPSVNQIFTTVSLEKLLEEASRGKFGRQISSGVAVCLEPVTIEDHAYGLCITAEGLELGKVLPDRSREARLIRPTFTFTASRDIVEDGQVKTQTQVLGQFTASSAVWNPRSARSSLASHWLLQDGQLFCPSDLNTQQLVLHRSSHWLQFMSTGELNRLLKLERVPDRQGAMLIKHVRFTDPINNLLMLLLGVPFVLSRERKIKASLALCVLTVGGFFAFIYICRFMDLPPSLAAWLPILLFGPVTVVMVDAIKT